MKSIIPTLIFFSLFLKSFSQNLQENQSFTYGEFKTGYGISIFGKGLKERYNAENFSTSGGGVYYISAFRKFKNVNYLNFGLKFKALGASPASNSNGDEMFFNYWGAALSTKYYPFTKEANKGIVLLIDYFFITQFTQKYRNQTNKIFEHQFAIGSGIAGGIGYEFMMFKDRFRSCVSIDYELDSRTGEVNNIGKKKFISQSLAITLGFKF